MKPLDTRKILEFYGLKYQPFSTEKPVSGIFAHSWMTEGAWLIENLVMDGGIAALVGDPGMGKSACMRYLHNRLGSIPDAVVVHLERPQSSLADFYRELGDIFGLELRVSYRWGGFRALRKKWADHILATGLRPVLVIDEAQLMQPVTMTELRLLSSEKFDSRTLLAAILAGDDRLEKKMENPELLPLKSRINPFLRVPAMDKKSAESMLKHLLADAGAPHLMNDTLVSILSNDCASNPRSLMQLGSTLLVTGFSKSNPQLDERLYYEVIQGRIDKARKMTGRKS